MQGLILAAGMGSRLKSLKIILNLWSTLMECH